MLGSSNSLQLHVQVSVACRKTTTISRWFAASDFDAARSAASSFQDRVALRKPAGGEQLLARLQDVVFALDEIARRQTIDKTWRFVRSNAAGMAGHSFGAQTTLGVGGQVYPGHPGIKEPRIAALVALIARISTDWWRAHLMGDSAAKTHLQLHEGLDAGDVWQVG